MDQKTISDVMREIGRKGWHKAGKASAARLTPEQRIERARKAGSAPKNRRQAGFLAWETLVLMLALSLFHLLVAPRFSFILFLLFFATGSAFCGYCIYKSGDIGGWAVWYFVAAIPAFAISWHFFFQVII